MVGRAPSGLRPEPIRLTCGESGRWTTHQDDEHAETFGDVIGPAAHIIGKPVQLRVKWPEPQAGDIPMSLLRGAREVDELDQQWFEFLSDGLSLYGFTPT
jgi:hypothetical protein